MMVKKRDGKLQEFDRDRISTAIIKAAAREIDPTPIVDKVVAHFCDFKKPIPIHKIQDFVEHALQCSAHKDIAKSYIRYRHARDINRESTSALLKSVKGFLDQSNDELTKENANKDAKSLNTHRDLLAGIMSKHYTVTQILPEDVAKAHSDGFIHVHDTDYMLSPLTNCCLVNYRDMLENGFKIGDAEIERPKSISVAATVLTQIIQAVSSAQYGGQTLAHIDSGLAPYVELSHKKLISEAKIWGHCDEWVEYRLHREVADAMQTFLYQVNTLTTSNGQAPFISISLGLDTSKYGRLITESYLNTHMKGLGVNGVTPVFPKVIFMLKDGVTVHPGDPNYDLKRLSIECSARRIYPDYLSVHKNLEVTGSTCTPVSPMGCRSFLTKYIDANGIEKYDGRFNLGVVSINLPMVAQESVNTNVDFWRMLDRYMDHAFKAHMIRVNRISGTVARQNPIMYMYGALARLSPDEKIDSLFYDGYASISLGFIGLAETLDILGKSGDKAYGMKILDRMKLQCDAWKSETRLGFSLYATPSEGYSLRAAKCFRRRFGDEVISRDYITNSFHMPVWQESSTISKWEYEAGFSGLCNAGHMSYIEEQSLVNNIDAYESYVNFAYKLHPYFGINTPVDRCYKCGYCGEFSATENGFSCPDCGNSDEGTLSVIRRVCGYLTAPNSRPLNQGKQQEVVQRVKHV